MMKLIASSEGVSIFCPDDGRFSFFNSPYPAHYGYTAVDVYPKSAFGNAASSPVEGEIIMVKRVNCPHGKGFKSSNYDHVILLRSLKDSERLIKILHVKPDVKVGDIIKPGEKLGTLLRSGFFDFWTDFHVHIEVRKTSDPIRARGGFKFERLMEFDEKEAVKDLSGIVVESKPEYSLVALNEMFRHGLPVDLVGQVGLLDAGIPQYGWIGAHTNTPPKLGGTVRLCGRKIGVVKSVYSNMCVAKCCDPIFTLNGRSVGLSLYLYPSSAPLVKIIPHKPGRLVLNKFEEVSVAIF